MNGGTPADPVQLGLDCEVSAFAKVNLTLHVTGQRSDGYHLLDSLVVRAGVGDVVRVAAADKLAFAVDGPHADCVPRDARNLVIRAAQFLDAGVGRGAFISLTKNLPPSSGIGGGSADAAAALRALSGHWGIPVPVDVTALGADVPVCLAKGPQRMMGVGEVLLPVPELPPCWMVLVNPGVGLSTPTVFAALACKRNAAMADVIPHFRNARAMAAWLDQQRNDLETPARGLEPRINQVLAALKGALLARMSGSGATCFGLYESSADAGVAAMRIKAAAPGWWVADAPVISSGG